MASKDTASLLQEVLDNIIENSQGLISATTLQTILLDFIQSRGVFEVYSEIKTYRINEHINYNNSIYKCIQDTNIGETPLSNPTKWESVITMDNVLLLQGSWDASTNTPDISLTSITGYTWRVSVAGNTDIGGITEWSIGDLVVKTATGWIKIDNEDIAAIWGNISGNIEDQNDLVDYVKSKTERQTVYITGDIPTAVKNINYIIDASGGMGTATLPTVTAGNKDRFYFTLEKDSNHYQIVVNGGIQKINGDLFLGLATQNGHVELVANGVDGYSIVIDGRVYDRVVNVLNDLNLASGYESGAFYNFQLLPAQSVTLTIPNPILEHVGMFATFSKHIGENASARVVSQNGIFDETITTNNKGFTIVTIYDEVNDEFDFVIKQDSRPSASNISINFLPTNINSIIEPTYKTLETTSQPEVLIQTAPITVTDPLNPQSLGFWLNDNKALVGELDDFAIDIYAQIRLIQIYTRNVQIKFNYYEYDYLTNTLNPTPILETSYSSIINTQVFEQKTIGGILPSNTWAETSTIGKALVIEFLAIKVGTGGVDSNPILEFRTGGTTPSRSTIAVPLSSANHNSLGGVIHAGSGVPDGHVNNSIPLQFPELTNAQRDAIISPSNGMQIYNTDTLSFEQSDSGKWYSINDIVLFTIGAAGDFLTLADMATYVNSKQFITKVSVTMLENYVPTMSISNLDLFEFEDGGFSPLDGTGTKVISISNVAYVIINAPEMSSTTQDTVLDITYSDYVELDEIGAFYISLGAVREFFIYTDSDFSTIGTLQILSSLGTINGFNMDIGTLQIGNNSNVAVYDDENNLGEISVINVIGRGSSLSISDNVLVPIGWENTFEYRYIAIGSNGFEQLMYHRGDNTFKTDVDLVTQLEQTATIEVGGLGIGDTIPLGSSLDEFISSIISPYISSSFSSFLVIFDISNNVEVGQTVTVQQATFGVILDSNGVGISNMYISGVGFSTNNFTTSPVTADLAPFEVTKLVVATETWTILGENTIPEPLQRTTTKTWLYRFLFGAESSVVVDAATAQIAYDAMQQSWLQNNKSRTVTCSADNENVNNYTYIIYPASFGDLSGVIQDGALPVLGAFTKIGDFTVNNSQGVSLSCRIYKSNAKGAFSNTTTLQIS